MEHRYNNMDRSYEHMEYSYNHTDHSYNHMEQSYNHTDHSCDHMEHSYNHSCGHMDCIDLQDKSIRETSYAKLPSNKLPCFDTV